MGCIGKVLILILLVVIVIIVGKVFIILIGEFGVLIEVYSVFFFKGFIDGYLILDGFVVLVFGNVVIYVLKEKGIIYKNSIVKVIIFVGFIVVFGLLFVYLVFVYFGVFSVLFGMGVNGGIILINVVNYLFGSYGILLLGIVIIVVCLIIFVGIVVVCGDYFFFLLLKFFY